MHMQSINSHSIPLFNLVNYIPLVATVVTCVLSVILARATLRYAEATDKSLALAREEFEREWSPELHIKLERLSASETRVVVTNLAKISVLLQLLQLFLRKVFFHHGHCLDCLDEFFGGDALRRAIPRGEAQVSTAARGP